MEIMEWVIEVSVKDVGGLRIESRRREDLRA